MNKRIAQICLVSLMMIFGTISVAASSPEEVPIIPVFDGQVYKITPGQVGVIQSRWIACNNGLVEAFINGTNHELVLVSEDETPILELTADEMVELWSPIERMGISFEECMGKQKPAISFWRIPLTDLSEGVYTLHFNAWADHLGTDGSDYDGDGKLDVFPAEFYNFSTVNTIIVE